MSRRKKGTLPLDAPLLDLGHRRPMTRRELISQGFMAGVGSVMAPSMLGMLGSARAHADVRLASDVEALLAGCNLGAANASRIPFICIDLAGGASIAGNALPGGPGGQLDFLSTSGYAKIGIPGDQVPGVTNADATENYDTTFGMAFHSDSGFLRGMLEKASAAAVNTHGAFIPARSENDTGNNPHNPMYPIHAVGGADGELATLIGSRSSDSGGNSMAPALVIDPTKRPTTVNRSSDVTGLVDTGELVNLLSHDDSVKVMESIHRISGARLPRVRDRFGASVQRQDVVEDLLQCGYVKTAYLVQQFGDPQSLNPALDPFIQQIFPGDELNDNEFEKTAAIMKMVISGYSGAGTITMGGYDYHNGTRATGETRDLRAGRCIGACLEYARLMNSPLMLYVFSDGGISSNGMVDDSADGRGKLAWSSDNQSTASAFFLVYDPNGRASPNPRFALGPDMGGPQIGYFTPDASAATSSSPAANNVNQLVQLVTMNYLALHGEQGQFASRWFNAYGSAPALGSDLDALTAFAPIV
jgi:hypothetical protein